MILVAWVISRSHIGPERRPWSEIRLCLDRLHLSWICMLIRKLRIVLGYVILLEVLSSRSISALHSRSVLWTSLVVVLVVGSVLRSL